jgi:hypothetical protein
VKPLKHDVNGYVIFTATTSQAGIDPLLHTHPPEEEPLAA